MQILLNGFISGLTIAILALGFAMVYLPTRVFHLALGGVYAGVPFIAWALLHAGVPWSLAICVSVATGVLVSVLCERFNHAGLDRKQAGAGLHLVSSLGIYIVLTQIVTIVWGSNTKTLRASVDAAFSLGFVQLTRSQIVAGGVSVLLLLLVFMWLRLTNLGLQFRALASNPRELALRGQNIQFLRLLCFGFAGLFASASSLSLAYDTGFDPHGGLSALLLAVVAVIIGGRESLAGAVIGGLLLGVLRSQVVWHASAKWQDSVTFILLVIFLFFRPNGIIAKNVRLEEQN